jgi:hypothetical protein
MTPSEMLWLWQNAQGKKRILEVGSWKGRSTHALCSGAAKTGGMVWAVDHFRGSEGEAEAILGRPLREGESDHHAEAKANPDAFYHNFLETMKGFDNLTVYRADSLEAAKEFPDGFFDMIFLDGSHIEADVRADILAWAPKCSGLLAGHDYQGGWPGVMAAVDSTLGKPDGVNASIWHKKVQAPEVNPLLTYMEDCVKKGLPISFVKRGDGEEAAMAGEKGANCDGHPYSEDLGRKLKTAFWHMDKLTAPRNGRTWVNVVPFEDQRFYNILLHRPDQNFDAVKGFWSAVRESEAHKIFVGPERLKAVAGMLKAEFVKIPLVNAFSEYDWIRGKLMQHAKPGTVFIFCASMVGKVWMAHLLERSAEISCIDAGSAWDPLFVPGGTRTMQLRQELLQREYAEWM